VAREKEEQARLGRLPTNRLFNSYRLYAYVKFCNDVRQGYLVQYINDLELDRADKAIKAVVAQITKEDTSINTDDIWEKALRSLAGRYAEDAVCRNALNQLFKMSPEPVYTIPKP
jgi:hypothetical protein